MRRFRTSRFGPPCDTWPEFHELRSCCVDLRIIRTTRGIPQGKNRYCNIIAQTPINCSIYTPYPDRAGTSTGRSVGLWTYHPNKLLHPFTHEPTPPDRGLRVGDGLRFWLPGRGLKVSGSRDLGGLTGVRGPLCQKLAKALSSGLDRCSLDSSAWTITPNTTSLTNAHTHTHTRARAKIMEYEPKQKTLGSFTAATIRKPGHRASDGSPLNHNERFRLQV